MTVSNHTGIEVEFKRFHRIHQIEICSPIFHQGNFYEKLCLIDIHPCTLDLTNPEFRERLENLLRSPSLQLGTIYFADGNFIHCTLCINGVPISSKLNTNILSSNVSEEFVEFSPSLNQRDNVLQNKDDKYKPYWGHLNYPVHADDKSGCLNLKLAKSLYTENKDRNKLLNRSFFSYIEGPSDSHTHMEIIGRAGIGKSWWVRRKASEQIQKGNHILFLDCLQIDIDNVKENISENVNRRLEKYVSFRKVAETITGNKETSVELDDAINLLFDQAKSSHETQARDRIRYYSVAGTPNLIVFVDNGDLWPSSAFENLISVLNMYFSSKPGVYLVATRRPESRAIRDRQGRQGQAQPISETIASPPLVDVLERRFRTNRFGDVIDTDNVSLPNSYSLGALFRDLVARYQDDEDSDTLTVFEKLCSYRITEVEKHQFDLRYFIGIMENILNNRHGLSFERLVDANHAIHAVLAPAGGSFNETGSYLFNLFDNGQSEYGNALIRFRVLEYVRVNGVMEEEMREFFEALGYRYSSVVAVVKAFDKFGAFDTSGSRDGESRKWRLSPAGEAQLKAAEMREYLVTIKTGMRIYKSAISYGDEAKDSLKMMNYIGNRKRKEYISRGWISDKRFVDFIAREMNREKAKLKSWVDKNMDETKNVEKINKITYLYGEMSDPALLVKRGLFG